MYFGPSETNILTVLTSLKRIIWYLYPSCCNFKTIIRTLVQSVVVIRTRTDDLMINSIAIYVYNSLCVYMYMCKYLSSNFVLLYVDFNQDFILNSIVICVYIIVYVYLHIYICRCYYPSSNLVFMCRFRFPFTPLYVAIICCPMMFSMVFSSPFAGTSIDVNCEY